MLARKSSVCGMSIIELMIGITIGLFILAGATLVVTGQLSEGRRLLTDTQIQQDLRAASDIIARDVRRAGYTGRASLNVWPKAIADGLVNPYADMTSEGSAMTASGNVVTSNLEYSFSSANSESGEDNLLKDSEVSGFQYNSRDKTIEIQLGKGDHGKGNWQALTDPNTVLITTFKITLSSQYLDVPCGEICPAVGVAGRPLQLSVRSVNYLIVGQSTKDPTVQRSISTTVRLRNDVVREKPCC